MRSRLLFAATVCLALGLPAAADAQGEGARTYWKAPANTHAVGTHLMFVDGNASGFNPALPVSGAAFASRIYMANYTAVSYTHLTLPTIVRECRSRWAPGD